MRILGLIPARGGSRGVPRKNVRLLVGRPLIQYTAEAAMASPSLFRVILSTDDEEIAEVGRRCGLDVPFLRPAELARDDTPMLPVVQHALRWAESTGAYFDAVCLLQPTNPLRTPEDIEGCLDLFQSTEADCVISVLTVPDTYNPHWVYFLRADGSLRLSTGEAAPIPRRQELPPAYHREGSVYVSRSSVVLEQNSLYGKKVLGYSMDPARSVNIDDFDDWLRAEKLLEVRTC